MNGVCNGTFFFGLAPCGPGEGLKGQISLNILNFNYKVNFQRFFNQTMFVFSHIRFKTYQTGFSFGRLGHAPGVGLRGTMGGLGGQFFFLIQPDLVHELLT